MTDTPESNPLMAAPEQTADTRKQLANISDAALSRVAAVMPPRPREN